MNLELIKKYLDGAALPWEREEIMAWIEAKEENKKDFLAYRKLYDINIWNADFTQTQMQTSKENKRNRSPLVLSLSKIAAACLICFLGIRLLLPYLTEPEDQTLAIRSITCPPGQRSELLLTDGTKVWLNSNSTIRIFDGEKQPVRRVELNGEAYFEVSHDKNRPFIVGTEQYDITVVGTSFNVFSYSGSSLFECSLIEGIVKLKSNLEDKEKEITLNPNEKWQKKEGLSSITHIDDNTLLWIKGVYAFRNKPLSAVFEHLALLHEVNIELKNKQIGEQMCTGKFRNKDGIDQILSILQKKYHFKYKKNEINNSYIIY
jgi:ferric-dicitrate binding protein FerR (iron transport regulator)